MPMRYICSDRLESRILLFAGDLDPAFSGDGIVSTQSQQRHVVAVHTDGKVYAARAGTNRDIQVTRFTAAGAADTTFGNNSVAIMNFADVPGSFTDVVVNDMIVQPDGKIVVVGSLDDWSSNRVSSNGIAARFNADGTRDLSFSGDGRLWLNGVDVQGSYCDFNAVTLQSDGRIVIGGESSLTAGLSFQGPAFVRLNTNGTYDTTFGGNGQQLLFFDNSVYVSAVSMTPDGKIVWGGYYDRTDPNVEEFAYGRLNDNGTFDTSFSGNGFEVTPFVSSYPISKIVDLQVLSNNKVVIVGSVAPNVPFDSNIGVLRLNADGSRDTTFGASNGRAEFSLGPAGLYDQAVSLEISSTGKYIIAGYWFEPGGSNSGDGVAMLNTDGSRDQGFGINGLTPPSPLSGSVTDMAIAPGGKIVATSYGTGLDPAAKVIRFDDRTNLTVGMFTFNSVMNETGQTSVSVEVTRDLALPTPTTVFLNLSGTAVYPIDGVINQPIDYTGTGITFPGEFVPLPFVVIPANASSTTFTFTAVNDTRVEGTETAVVSLADVGTYDAFAPRSLTLTILDNDFSPEVTAREFLFNTSPHKVEFVFSQDVGPSLAASDFVFTGPGTVPARTLVYDAQSLAATITFAGNILPDGNYTATLPANRVVNSVGNPNTVAFSLNYFVFAGDANRDRVVNVSDFAILAARFNLPGTFSQGDFNYDGVTNISDFAILASKFNTTLPAPADFPVNRDAARTNGAMARSASLWNDERVIELVEEQRAIDVVA